MKRIAILACLLVALFVGAYYTRAEFLRESVQPYSEASFKQWLSQSPQRERTFAEFADYLRRNGVANVVPTWQLTRTDAATGKKCERPEFLIPPRDEWSAIVPVLRLVEAVVKPEVGDVEVYSSYRTQDFNDCIGGASRSYHLSFAAVDLVAVKPIPNGELFSRLCKAQRRLGPESQFGLGAYFDPTQPKANRIGRFHVDVSGHRSWGANKHAGSSGCRALL